MSRIAAQFSEPSKNGHSALITFITAGDPDFGSTVPAMHALVRGGADIIELGVPFTDPEADGPSIQRSSERALQHKITMRSVCNLVAEFRKTNVKTPVVLMGYLNPILALGIENSAKIFHESGVDGLIIVNLPPEESAELKAAVSPFGIDLIFLIAPTTSEERIASIAKEGSGFLYYVSIKGITGADHLDTQSVKSHLTAIRKKTKLPIAVGFGIKTPEVASEIAKFADGVVVGSALVDTMGSRKSAADMLATLQDQVKGLATGVHETT